eukprot:s1927_g2.t1
MLIYSSDVKEDAEMEKKKEEDEEDEDEEEAEPAPKMEAAEEPPKPKAVPKEENNEMTQQRAELKILRAINQVRKATAKSFAEARANLELLGVEAVPQRNGAGAVFGLLPRAKDCGPNFRKVIADELPHAGAVAEELSAEAEHASEEMAKELGLSRPKEEKPKDEPKPKEPMSPSNETVVIG